MSCPEMTGDLLEPGLPAVGHGCDCKGSMGASAVHRAVLTREVTLG